MSTANSNPLINLQATPDPFSVVTSGENLGKAIIDLVAQVDRENNTPLQIQAAIDNHIQSLKDRLIQAEKDGDLETIRRFGAL